MIIRQDGTYETHSLFPNVNWYLGERNLIIDETTEAGREMAKMYIDNFPLVDFTTDVDGFVIRVNVIEVEKLPEVENKKIELVKDAQGVWENIYVDIPLTKEQELELQLAGLQQAMAELTMMMTP